MYNQKVNQICKPNKERMIIQMIRSAKLAIGCLIFFVLFILVLFATGNSEQNTITYADTISATIEKVPSSDDTISEDSENAKAETNSIRLGHTEVAPPAFVAITTDALNMRTAPDYEATPKKVLRSDTLVIVHDTSHAPWWLVEQNGTKGYCHSDYLKAYEFSETDEYPLATYTTTYSTKKSQSGRVFNISKAALLLDGTEVKPGAIFSILDVIGPINQRAGYEEAIEYRTTNGEAYAAIGYGGGVCQVSSTLYNAWLLTEEKVNLKIVERHTHALPVSYVPDGKDATISYESKKDFKFKNLSEHTLKIRCYVSEKGALSIYIAVKEME